MMTRYGSWLCALLAAASAGCGGGEREPDPGGSEEIGAAKQAILSGTPGIPRDAGFNAVRITIDRLAKIYCTGTILTPRWVLTANHCQIAAGQDVLHEPSHDTQQVKRKVSYGGRDLALVELRQTFGANAVDEWWQPIALAGTNWPLDTRVVTWGYGRSYDSVAGVANSREWYITRSPAAGLFFEFFNNANAAGGQVEQGDSGGGSFLLENVNGVQAGALIAVSRDHRPGNGTTVNTFEAITPQVYQWIQDTIDPAPVGAFSHFTANLDAVGTASDVSAPGAAVNVEVRCESPTGTFCGSSTGSTGAGDAFRVPASFPHDQRWYRLKVFAHNIGPSRYSLELTTSDVLACRRPDGTPCDGQLLRTPSGEHFLVVGLAAISLTGPAEAGALGYPQNNFHLDDTGALATLRTVPLDRTVLRDGQTPGNPSYAIVLGAKIQLTSPELAAHLGVTQSIPQLVPARAIAQIPDTPQRVEPDSPYVAPWSRIDAVTAAGTVCSWIIVGGARFLAPTSPPECSAAQPLAPASVTGGGSLINGADPPAGASYRLPLAFVYAIPTVPGDGYFLREVSSGVVHYTYGGGKLPIRSQDVLQALARNQPVPTVAVVADGALAHLPDRTFYGKLDFAHSWGEVHGWAVDVKTPAAAALVDIYMDARPGEAGSIKLGRAVANIVDRPDINGYLNVTGTHGFRFLVPAQYRDGKQHDFYAYGVDPAVPAPGVALELRGTTNLYRLVSNVDGADRGGHVRGWVADLGAPAQPPKLEFSAQRKGSGGGSVYCAMSVPMTATVPRPDVDARFGVSGVRGFDFTVPDACRDGNPWTYRIYATVPSAPGVYSYPAVDRPLPRPGPDRMLSGDFLGRGRKQLLFANGDGRGGKLLVVHYGGAEPFGKAERMDPWSSDQAHTEFFDAEDQWLAGDFLGVGHDQLLLSNRPPEGTSDGQRLRILDLHGPSPSTVAYAESWSDPLPGGGADPQNADIALRGDFLHRGYDQVLFVNHGGAGSDSPYAIYDYKKKQAGGALLADSGSIDAAWTSSDDRWVVGDFLHRGHDQILFTNRQQGGAGRVTVYDPLSGTHDYLEPWGASPLLDGWMDEDDLLVSGDFFGLGYDQAMYVNRGGAGGKVLVLDYSSRVVPGQSKLRLDWSSSHLNGFLDREETWAVGDFYGHGCAAIAHLDYSGRGGKLAMSDYKWGAAYFYWQDWGATNLLDGWTDPPRGTPSIVAPIAGRAGIGELGAPLAPSAPLRSGWTSQDFAEGFVYAHPSWSPFAVRGVFRDRYAAMGRENSFLKYPFGEETWTAGARGRTLAFQGGAIYWRPDLGAVPVSTPTRSRWISSFGGETGFLGYPVEQGQARDGGEYTHFEGGSIYSKTGFQAPGTHEIHGSIRDRYQGLGWEWSALGYPTTDELPVSGSLARYNDFEGGSIYWHPSFGAHPLVTAIRQLWFQQGGASGWMGYPTGGGPGANGGYHALFQSGCIYWHPNTGAHLLSSLRNKYLQLGAEAGRLGYIKTDEGAPPGIPSARIAEFEGGTLWLPPQWPAAYALFSGPVRDKYLQLGGPNSGLGYPDRDEVIDAVTGRREGHFQGATIVYQPGVGTTVTYLPPPPDPDPGPDLCETKPWMCNPK